MSGVTHRLAEERSLALHREVARRLQDRPELLEMARERVRGWLDSGSVSRFWAEAWDDALDGILEDVIARITDTSENARALRQTSPFAGVVGPRERWEILRRHRGQAVSS
jgi:phosphoserine phosphatase